MKERCRDGCRTSLLIAGVVLVPAIFHTLLPPCHPYITIHFMEMIFSTCYISAVTLRECNLDLRVRALCRRRATRVQLTCALGFPRLHARLKYQRNERDRLLATLRKISRVLAAFMRLREAFLRIRMSSILPDFFFSLQ